MQPAGVLPATLSNIRSVPVKVRFVKVLRISLALLVAGTAVAGWYWREPLLTALYGKPIPRPLVQIAIVDPLAAEGLEGYRAYRDALHANDLDVIAGLSTADDSYLALRSALTLARHWSLSPAERLPHYLRAQELRIHDALARDTNRAFLLEVASTAEAAGDTETAISYYREALPSSEAISALERLITDPYRLAAAFLAGRQYSRALDALGGLAAPSIEAPAQRALGDHAAGLDAYERWLSEEPDNTEALLGRAWSNFYLNNNEVADAQFKALAGSNALYGRGLLANRAGDLDAATEFLFASGDPYHLWLATDLLERAGRPADAIRFYLRLAAGSSAYAEQAAFRAYVLGGRLDRPDVTQQALELIPSDSFYSLVLGNPLQLPEGQSEATVEPAAAVRAARLARALDEDAAIGELLFALRASTDPEETLALAETLQAYGEFRHSRVAAQELLPGRQDDRRVWRLAWPEAFADEVRSSAAATGAEAEWVWAIMRQESAFYPLAVSTSNARGLMQVVPSTWDWLAELQREEPADVFDVSANIRYGAFYLNWLRNYFDGDIELATASYNRGQGYIGRLFAGDDVAGDKAELFRQIDAQETRNYLERVMVNYHVYIGLSQGLTSVPSRVSQSALAVAAAD